MNYDPFKFCLSINSDDFNKTKHESTPEGHTYNTDSWNFF